MRQGPLPSLARQTLSAGLILLGISCATQGAWVWRHVQAELHKEAQDQARLIARSAVVAAQTAATPASLIRHMNGLGAAGSITNLMILRAQPNGQAQVIASIENEWIGRPAPFADTPHLKGLYERLQQQASANHLIEHNHIYWAEPVLLTSDDRLRTDHGMVFVDLSFEDAQLASREKVLTISGLLGVISALSTMGLLMMLRKDVLRPLQTLREAMRRKSEGQDTTLVKTAGNREIADVANSYNELMRILDQQSSRLNTIMDTVPDAMITLDLNETILSANQAAARLFGVSEDSMVGQPFSRFMPANYDPQHDGLISHFHANLQDGCHNRGKELLLQIHDTAVPIELTIGRSLRDGSMLYVCVLRDVSERKRNERLKGEFIATVSHELRTPLTSIRASLELLNERYMGDAQPKIKRLVDIANDNSSRLAVLINDILDIQKLQSGNLTLNTQAVDVAAMVQQAIEMNQPFADKFQVTLKTGQITPCHMLADPERAMQVLVNLLSNAAKFTRVGSEVEVSTTVSDGYVVCSVRDQGEGIPDEFKSRIFQKFSQADSASTRKREGTGLGLHITQQIVQAMQGNIWFETQAGVGTTFRFRLPLAG